MDRKAKRKLIRNLEKQMQRGGKGNLVKAARGGMQPAIVQTRELMLGNVHSELWPVSVEFVLGEAGQIQPLVLPTSRLIASLWGAFECMVEGCTTKPATVQHIATQVVDEENKVTEIDGRQVRGQVISMHGYICLKHSIEIGAKSAIRKLLVAGGAA